MRPTPNIGPSVPAFLRKLWKIVNDPTIDELVSWSPDGESFVIRNPAEFCYNLLPIYYKHNNMSSFIRQLNMYGFHKLANENGCDKDEIRFFHPFFQQDQSRLLQHIKRKIGAGKPEERQVPLDQIGKVLSDVKQLRGRQESVDSQLASMKQENAALWRELALLRQKHMKQQQIVNKLIHFLVSLVQQPGARTTIGVKRRFPLMLSDGSPRGGKALKVAAPASPAKGATIHEIEAESPQPEDVMLEDILDVSLDGEEDPEGREPAVEELLGDSDPMGDISLGEDAAEMVCSLETPQPLSEDDGGILESNLLEAAAEEDSTSQFLHALAAAEHGKLAVARLPAGGAADIGLHVDSTHGELQSIKELLFDGGYTLDANAFLDLFSPGGGAWPEGSSQDSDQLFSGSELISYASQDPLNFDTLLQEA